MWCNPHSPLVFWVLLCISTICFESAMEKTKSWLLRTGRSQSFGFFLAGPSLVWCGVLLWGRPHREKDRDRDTGSNNCICVRVTGWIQKNNTLSQTYTDIILAVLAVYAVYQCHPSVSYSESNFIHNTKPVSFKGHLKIQGSVSPHVLFVCLLLRISVKESIYEKTDMKNDWM